MLSDAAPVPACPRRHRLHTALSAPTRDRRHPRQTPAPAGVPVAQPGGKGETAALAEATEDDPPGRDADRPVDEAVKQPVHGGHGLVEPCGGGCW